MDISRYRQRLRELFNKQLRLLESILKVRGIVRGGIYLSKSKCGKAGCKCEKEGKLHEVWKYYWSEGGKTRIRSIGEAERIRYLRYTKEYQRYRRIRAELVKTQREQIRLISLLEKGLRERLTEKRLKKAGRT